MWYMRGKTTRYVGAVALAIGLVTVPFVPAALAITNEGKCFWKQFTLALPDDAPGPMP